MNKIIQAYKSMSAADLAKKCGVGIDTVYGWRTESKKTRPAVISIVRLSVSLGVSSEECAEAISSLCGKNIEVQCRKHGFLRLPEGFTRGAHD